MDQAKQSLVHAFDELLKVLSTPSDSGARSTIACLSELHLKTHDFQRAMLGSRPLALIPTRDTLLGQFNTYLSSLNPRVSLLDLLSCVARGLSKQCVSLSPVVITQETADVQVSVPFFYWLVKHHRLIPTQLKLRQFTDQFQEELVSDFPNHRLLCSLDGRVTLSLETWRTVVTRPTDHPVIYLTEFDRVPNKHRHQSDLVEALKAEEQTGCVTDDPRARLAQWLDNQYIPALSFSRSQVRTTAYSCTTSDDPEFEASQPCRTELLQPRLIDALLAVLSLPSSKKRCVRDL
jgi:hypothetical protein